MEPLKIEPTDETPQVILDANNNAFEFSGKSLPEDVLTFYNPVVEWLNQYAINPNPVSNFVFKMVYFNTASSKLILDIMMILDEIHENGNEVKILWHYMEDDEDMMEAGEEYADMLEVPFEQISYK